MGKIAALYVACGGVYFEDERIDPYCIHKDAKSYRGSCPVIAHPPCERWGRYWSGGPSAKEKKAMGDDGGSFEFALERIRECGGVLEHPEGSHAFRFYGLPLPKWREGWTEPDAHGGRSCCVAQGNYGHKSRKLTWLYAILPEYPEMDWSVPSGMWRMDNGNHGKQKDKHWKMSKKARKATPLEFKELLIRLVQGK